MNLFLIGMRGAGKSTAGSLAAAQLHIPFVDCDREVEARSGKTINQIFAERGEPAFRRLERAVLTELLGDGNKSHKGALIATGGGCVLDPGTRAALEETRRVIWLEASLKVLRFRLEESNRPSLTGARPEDELEILLQLREPLYAQCATVSLDTSDMSPQEVSRVIQQFWSDLPHHHLR